MKISGFTILRDAVRLGYPFEASIRSLLPLVDEYVVSIGDGADGEATWQIVTAIGDPRIKPFRSTWAGPGVLSRQTNIALARCTGDWAMYLQADEVVHGDDLDAVGRAMRDHLSRRTEGLIFRYLHFWRDRGHVADDWLRFYPRAVRAVKTGRGVESVGDACGFACRHGDRTRGLLKADSGARIFHYGWCNPSALQATRFENLARKIYGDDVPAEAPAIIFSGCTVRRFEGTHPDTMEGIAVHAPAGPDPDTARLPAWLRASAGVLRSPIAKRRDIRWFLPLTLTNAWWRTAGWLRRSRPTA